MELLEFFVFENGGSSFGFEVDFLLFEEFLEVILSVEADFVVQILHLTEFLFVVLV